MTITKNKIASFFLAAMALASISFEVHAIPIAEYCNMLQSNSAKAREYERMVQTGMCPGARKQEMDTMREAAAAPWKNKLYDIPKGAVVCTNPTFIQAIKSGVPDELSTRLRQKVCFLASSDIPNRRFKRVYELPINGKPVKIFAVNPGNSDWDWVVDGRDLNIHD